MSRMEFEGWGAVGDWGEAGRDLGEATIPVPRNNMRNEICNAVYMCCLRMKLRFGAVLVSVHRLLKHAGSTDTASSLQGPS